MGRGEDQELNRQDAKVAERKKRKKWSQIKEFLSFPLFFLSATLASWRFNSSILPGGSPARSGSLAGGRPGRPGFQPVPRSGAGGGRRGRRWGGRRRRRSRLLLRARRDRRGRGARRRRSGLPS